SKVLPLAAQGSVPRGFRFLWAAAVLVPLLGVAGAGIMSWRDVRQEAEARLQRTVEMLNQHALRAFVTQETILAAIAGRVQGMSPEEIRASAGVHAFIRDLTESAAPLVSGIVVADAEDRTASASYEFPARVANLSDRDYLKALRAGAPIAIGEVVEARPMGWRLFSVARPRPEGGSVISSFSPDAFSKFYGTIAESPGDVVVLFRKDGAVLTRHPPPTSGMPTGPNTAIAALLERLRHGTEVLAVTSPVDGLERLHTVRQVGDYPVLVTYGLDMSALHATWRRRMVAPLLGGVAAAGLLLALTWIAQGSARQLLAVAEARREAEVQLARAGRSTAIGLLAGGVAHDFKNLVQAVRSGTRVIDRKAEDPAEVRRYAEMMAGAAERGGRLVDAMMHFARVRADSDVPPELDVAAALRDLKPLLDRTLGARWAVELVLPPMLPYGRGDRTGFEAAVVNLAANARDAMPGGGVVVISADLADEAAEPPPPDGLTPGRYVVAEVSDTGAGMDPETLSRAGEPFFTTKSAGQGIGLGLATVRGFATRAGGVLRLTSAPGEGTRAAIWLPVAS
ncbi:MAG TPA: ATP-binding protein, partial [Acetobacteraceae bacterium]|nr:ATP-binding protein [Acetobacteraceae bacterium]